jgi:ABC-type multidrug transport system ATPase subunit
VLLVEQNLRVAEELATDAIVLDEGRVEWSGSMQDLVGDDERKRSLLGVGRRRTTGVDDHEHASAPTEPGGEA